MSFLPSGLKPEPRAIHQNQTDVPGSDGSRPPLFLLSRYPRPRLGRSRLARAMGDA